VVGLHHHTALIRPEFLALAWIEGGDG